MSIERMKTMKEAFMCAVEGQMYNLAEVDAEELGEVVDMIKDLSEAIYYCEVTKAMEESEKNGKNGNGSQGQEMMYYTPPMYYPMYYNGSGDQGGGGQSGGGQSGGGSQYYERGGNTDGRDMPRMYYNGGSSGGGNSGGGGRSGGGGNSGGSSSGGGGGSQYSEREFPGAFQDEREGRSPRSRRMYMEAKETKQDKAIQMRELEKYMQELA